MAEFRIIWGILNSTVGLGLFIVGLGFLSEDDGSCQAVSIETNIPENVMKLTLANRLTICYTTCVGWITYTERKMKWNRKESTILFRKLA